MNRALALLVLVPVLVACGPPPPTPALGCDQAVATDLGYLTTGRWAWFTTTGGRTEFSVTDPYDGTVSLSPTGRTISLGPATTVPELGSDNRVANAVASVRVDPEHPGTVELAAGSYWVASYAAPTTMRTCPDVAISGVLPAVGTAATTTPSPSALGS